MDCVKLTDEEMEGEQLRLCVSKIHFETGDRETVMDRFISFLTQIKNGLFRFI